MLMESLKADQLAARKAKNATKTGLLTALIGEAAMIGKNAGNRESTDAEVLGMIRKFLKNAKETKIILEEKMNIEALEKTKEEIRILESYLPTQMDEEKLREIIKEFVAAQSTPNVGSAMKYLKDNFVGQYDPKWASEIVKSLMG